MVEGTKGSYAGARCISAVTWREVTLMTVEFVEVRTTIDTKEGAQKIAETLVSKRLAACVQVGGPITSTYWWQGKIEVAEEWICTVKTRRELYEKIEQAIREVHSYDEPEILARSEEHTSELQSHSDLVC